MFKNKNSMVRDRLFLLFLITITMILITFVLASQLQEENDYFLLSNELNTYKIMKTGIQVTNPPNEWAEIRWCLEGTVGATRISRCVSEIEDLTWQNGTDALGGVWLYGRGKFTTPLGNLWIGVNYSLANESDKIKIELGAFNDLSQPITDLIFAYNHHNITIANTTEDDYLGGYVNDIWQQVRLNRTNLDQNVTDLTNNTFKIFDSCGEGCCGSIKMNWTNPNAYVYLRSQPTQEYNTPVRLIIPAGNLAVGQTKKTTLNWVDSGWFYDVSLTESSTTAYVNSSITITGTYQCLYTDCDGSTIGLNAWYNSKADYIYLDGDCDDENDVFKVTAITCDAAGGSCSTNVAAGSISLITFAAGKTTGDNIWTLQACDTGITNSPYELLTYYISGDESRFIDDYTNEISIYNPPNFVVLRPSDVGTYNNWGPFGGESTTWEATKDDLYTTYVQNETDEMKETEDIQNLSSVTVINNVTVHSTCCVFAGAGAGEAVATLIRSGSTDSEGDSTGIADCPSWTNYTTTHTTDPNTASAWTLVGVNNLQIGAIFKAGDTDEPIRCSEFIAEVHGVDVVKEVPSLANLEAKQIQCENNSVWSNCSELVYDNTITKMRVNCSMVDYYIMNATFNFTNMDDGTRQIYQNATSNESGGWWILDNTDYQIKESGDWNLTITCIDSNGDTDTNSTLWDIPFGWINISWFTPTNNDNHTQYAYKTYTIKVDCIDGECGDVNVSLDPIVTLRPDGAGEYQSWSVVGGVGQDHWTKVNDDPFDDSSYLRVFTEEYKETETITDMPSASSIDNVTVYARCCVSGGGGGAAEKGATLIRSGITDDEGVETTLTDCDTWSDLEENFATDPATSLAWTEAGVNALEIGAINKQSGIGEAIRCSEFFANVSYTPPADVEYPVFSNYKDNNGSLLDSGTAWFNVTVESTNSTVFLEIDATNYTATNLTSNVYNVTVTGLTGGEYTYYWGAWGNGTLTNYNTSNVQDYTINQTQPKGLISTTVGDTPFYTINANPNNTACYDMKKDGNCNISWIVNATGTLDNNYTFFAYANATNYSTAVNSNTTNSINITIIEEAPITCSMAIAFSTNLSDQIRFDVSNIPINNLSAGGNNGTGVTQFYINISNTDCTSDLNIMGDGDLISGSNTIALANETYSHNSTENTVPSNSMIGFTTDYVLLETSLDDGVYYFKFYLNVPSGQSAGEYKNNAYFKINQTG